MKNLFLSNFWYAQKSSTAVFQCEKSIYVRGNTYVYQTNQTFTFSVYENKVSQLAINVQFEIEQQQTEKESNCRSVKEIFNRF